MSNNYWYLLLLSMLTILYVFNLFHKMCQLYVHDFVLKWKCEILHIYIKIDTNFHFLQFLIQPFFFVFL